MEAVEGRFYDPLVHMLATDGDGTDTSSKICHYHILTSDVPFEVDSNGKSNAKLILKSVFNVAHLIAMLCKIVAVNKFNQLELSCSENKSGQAMNLYFVLY